MNLLLDTHTLLWFLREPERLPVHVAEAIESAGRQAFVSMATLWEIDQGLPRQAVSSG